MTTSTPAGLMVQRYECKYVVPETQARQVLASLSAFLRPDAHAAKHPNNTYAICSLYLDSDGLPLCRETLEGKDQRFKLRIRSYSDDPAARVFLEVKRRLTGVVRKTRCTVQKALLPSLCAGRSIKLERIDAMQVHGLAEFTRLMLETCAKPRLLVRYDREAYVGAIDDSVRVTFDRNLRAKRTDRPEVIVNASGFTHLPVKGVILELKFNDRCPAWLLQVVQRHGLRRTSFSKYCNSIVGTGSRDLRQAL